MEIKELTLADMDALISLYIAYYNGHEGSCWTDATVRRRMRQVITREDSFGLTLWEGNQPLGFLMGYYEQFDDGEAYDLVEIVVDENHQGRGFGTALMQELEKRATERGALLVQTEAVADERHDRFYGRLGYGDCGNLRSKCKMLVE